jgi:hypothetical protein
MSEAKTGNETNTQAGTKDGKASDDSWWMAGAVMLAAFFLFLTVVICTKGFEDRAEDALKEKALRDKLLAVALTQLFPSDSAEIRRAFGVEPLPQHCPARPEDVVQAGQ